MGEQSFKMTSTTSRLILFSFLHHHHHPCHHPCHHNLPTIARNHPAMSPPPLLRDVGSTINTWDAQNGWQLHPPLPSPKGCGQVHTCSTVELGGRNTKGDPKSGRPAKCIAKTDYDTCCSPFFSHHFLPQPPTHPLTCMCYPHIWYTSNCP